MIGFFPEPYPDELLYSICSRYHERTGYRSREATGRDLFGAERVNVAIDLPCNIDSLVAALPLRHRHTANQFIDNNTLLPFHGPFVPPQRLKCLREDMHGNNGGAIHGRIGILTSNISIQFLRFCPSCVEADREKFEETYWHRLHHVPGVVVCPIHKIFLENSPVLVRGRGNHEAFSTAEQAVFPVAARSLDDANREHQAYLQIARDAAWLLDQQGLIEEPGIHRKRYIGSLFEKGFSTYFGNVRTSKLVTALNDYYTPELLERLGCGLEKSYNWLHRLVHNTNRAQHPLQHLLLMQFLGCNPASFFLAPIERVPFGEGPWPCLNRASDHFGQSLIPQYELTPTHLDRKPRGTFRCECGFAYFRIGPDRLEESRFQMDGYVTFGEVWEEALRKFYKDDTCTHEQLAECLGVSSGTIQKQIKRLGLDDLLGAEKSAAPATSSSSKTERGKKIDDAELREKNRTLILEIMKARPAAGRCQLRELQTVAYNWLLDNDREWLEVNLPARQIPRGPAAYINWLERDVGISKAVTDEAERIRSASGRPIWISTTCIAKRIGKLAVISKYGEKLPLTIKTLKEVSESVEDYAIRRVRWAAECYRLEGNSASGWQLQIKAAVSNKIVKLPAVKSAINDAILSLERGL